MFASANLRAGGWNRANVRGRGHVDRATIADRTVGGARRILHMSREVKRIRHCRRASDIAIGRV